MDYPGLVDSPPAQQPRSSSSYQPPQQQHFRQQQQFMAQQPQMQEQQEMMGNADRDYSQQANANFVEYQRSQQQHQYGIAEEFGGGDGIQKPPVVPFSDSWAPTTAGRYASNSVAASGNDSWISASRSSNTNAMERGNINDDANSGFQADYQRQQASGGGGSSSGFSRTSASASYFSSTPPVGDQQHFRMGSGTAASRYDDFAGAAGQEMSAGPPRIQSWSMEGGGGGSNDGHGENGMFQSGSKLELEEARLRAQHLYAERCRQNLATEQQQRAAAMNNSAAAVQSSASLTAATAEAFAFPATAAPTSPERQAAALFGHLCSTLAVPTSGQQQQQMQVVQREQHSSAAVGQQEERPGSSNTTNSSFLLGGGGDNGASSSRKRPFEQPPPPPPPPPSQQPIDETGGIGIAAVAHQQQPPPPAAAAAYVPPVEKRPRYALVSYSAAPPAVHKNMAEESREPKFNFYTGRFEIDLASPLENEIQRSVLEMRQELAYVDTLGPQIMDNLQHSKRLLSTECGKFDESINPEWLELDIQRPIKLCRQVLIPNFRYPNINFIGRIIGFRGTTLQKICKKYKCFMSILGAYSTKDRKQEIELYNSGDYRFMHFASPLHIRVDVIAPAHLAHMRMAAVLNVLQKLLVPNRDFDVEEFLSDVNLLEPREPRPQNREARMEKQERELNSLDAEFDAEIGAGGGGASRWRRQFPNPGRVIANSPTARGGGKGGGGGHSRGAWGEAYRANGSGTWEPPPPEEQQQHQNAVDINSNNSAEAQPPSANYFNALNAAATAQMAALAAAAASLSARGRAGPPAQRGVGRGGFVPRWMVNQLKQQHQTGSDSGEGGGGEGSGDGNNRANDGGDTGNNAGTAAADNANVAG